MKEVFRDAWRLMAPYWSSEERWKARGLLVGVVTTVLIGIYFQVLINEWSRITFDAFQNYNVDLFISQWKYFALYLTGFLVAFMTQVYFKNKLIIAWRRWMTSDLLEKWLEHKAYYKMYLYKLDTDNPDQRISQDIDEFVSSTETVFINSIDNILTLITFSFILWNLSGNFPVPDFVPLIGGKAIPGFLFWIAVTYSLISTYISFRFGKTIVGVMFNKEKFEANFRYSLMRIRENTESIALYHAEKAEKKRSMSFYKDIIGNMYKMMYWNIRYFLWTNFIVNISGNLPILISAPLYFAKKIQFGGVMQIVNAMSLVQNSILHFTQILPNLASLRAATKRLVGFLNDIESIEEKNEQVSHILHVIDTKAESVVVNLNFISLPTGQDLVKDIYITLKKGESVLFSGPSGSGKSTFLRVLSGLWPLGQGSVTMPDMKDILFVPQRPYIPLGNLRDVLLYPYQDNINKEHKIEDKQIKDILTKVGLSKFVNNLEDDYEWPKILSLGEQQKISFFRILLHKPKWIFLDEVTSSLDELAEKTLYNLITKEIPGLTKISVGHRNTVKEFHNRCIYFNTMDGSTAVLEERSIA